MSTCKERCLCGWYSVEARSFAKELRNFSTLISDFYYFKSYIVHLHCILTIIILTLDGRISEDSAVELGDIITDEEEIIEELIKRGTVSSLF